MALDIIIIVFLMTVAIVLVQLEIFMLPGITVAGVGGFLFAIGGVWFAYSVSTVTGHFTLGLSLLAFVISFVWLLRSNSFNRVALKTDVGSKLRSTNEMGIQPGDEGISVSRLAPIGKARINGTTIEAQSIGEFINEKTIIEVVKINGYNVIVKEKENTVTHS